MICTKAASRSPNSPYLSTERQHLAEHQRPVDRVAEAVADNLPIHLAEQAQAQEVTYHFWRGSCIWRMFVMFSILRLEERREVVELFLAGARRVDVVRRQDFPALGDGDQRDAAEGAADPGVTPEETDELLARDVGEPTAAGRAKPRPAMSTGTSSSGFARARVADPGWWRSSLAPPSRRHAIGRSRGPRAPAQLQPSPTSQQHGAAIAKASRHEGKAGRSRGRVRLDRSLLAQ